MSKVKKRGGRRPAKDVSSDEEELPPAPPRPFNNVEGLPLSLEEPEYSILNTPLSLKDSAVLYSSLMKSRRAYISGNIFDLYWAKGKTKFDNDTNARDRMNKLCDCSMEIGPHTFDVRFFILKDDEIEKKRQLEKDKKRERRIANKKLREEKKKLREEKKLQQANSGENKLGDAEQKKEDSDGKEGEDKLINGAEKKDEDEDDNSGSDDDEDDEDDEDEDKDDETGTGTESQSRVQSEHQESEPPESKPQESEPPEPKPQESEPQEPAKTPEVTEEGDTGKGKPLPPLQVQAPTSSDKSVDPTEDTNSTLNPNKRSAKKDKEAGATSQQPAAPVDPMQTPESQMMIANLNAIARIDPSLNTLMKIVATGNARPDQVREFQGYIQRAKAMGPPPFFKDAFPNYPHATTTKVKTPAVPKAKSVKPPKPPKKPKPPKENQLTTFQELYVNGADLVFEFSENPNVRYHLPKDCIIEKIPDTGILISMLVIHNRDQIKKFKDRQQAKKEKLEKLEEEKKKDTPVETASIQEEAAVEEAPPANKRGSRRGRPKATSVVVKDEKKPEEVQEEPIPYFSAISFKLNSIMPKHDPIFVNSFHKYEEVKEGMEAVLKKGIRVPKTFVWYSVDAFEDEELAEGLRHQLYLIENPPKGKYKKDLWKIV